MAVENIFTLIFAKRTTVQKTMIGLVFRQYQANKTNNNILFKSKQIVLESEILTVLKESKMFMQRSMSRQETMREMGWNITVGNNVSTVKEPDRWESWYPPSAFGYVIEIWLWYRSIEERTYFWLKRPHQPSTPPNCWSFQSSSANSKKKYCVPAELAWQTKVSMKFCRLATDATDGPLLAFPASDDF